MSMLGLTYMTVGFPDPCVLDGPAADFGDVQPVWHQRVPQARRQTRRLLQTGPYTHI